MTGAGWNLAVLTAFAAVLWCAESADSADDLAVPPHPTALPERVVPEFSVAELPAPWTDGSCWQACPAPGTLFRWSHNPSQTGGPNFDEPIVTDRPDFTEASVTVGRGIAQLEFGYTYEYDNAGGVSTRAQSWGEPLLRYGILADWLELRLGLFPLEERTRDAFGSNTTAGTEDLYVGFKVALTPQAGILPEMAVIPQAQVPTGSRAFTNDEFLPGVNWIYSWDINDRLSTAGSTQVNRATEELPPLAPGADARRNAYTEYAQSWTVGYSLTERVGTYTEWFAFFPHAAEEARVEHYLNGGITWLISDDIQWDIRSGWGLNGAAADYFAGTGLSIRFGRHSRR